MLITSSNIHNFYPYLGDLADNTTTSAKNLGVLFDFKLSFKGQINTVVQTCFHHLKLVHTIKPLLTHTDLEKVFMFLFSLDLTIAMLYMSVSHNPQFANYNLCKIPLPDFSPHI